MPLGPTDPCTLVTLDEAQTAIGTALNEGLVSGHGEELSCTYTGPTTGPLAQVEVFVGDGAKKFLDIDRELGHTFTAVTKLGDEATVEPGTIFVRQGSTWIAIRMTTLDDLTLLQPALEALAHNAVSRIPAV